MSNNQSIKIIYGASSIWQLFTTTNYIRNVTIRNKLKKKNQKKF